MPCALCLRGVDSNLGRYIDYETPHPEEEAENVFRVYAKTKHYTKKERFGAGCAFLVWEVQALYCATDQR